MKKLPHTSIHLLLVAVAGLLFSSCAPTSTPGLNSAHGTPALGELQVNQTVQTYLSHRPRTLQEMSELMGETPMAIGSDPKGDYAHWYRTETTMRGGKVHIHAAWAAALSRKGKLIASCIRLSDPNDISRQTCHGDASLYNPALHPGLTRVMESHTQFRIEEAQSELRQSQQQNKGGDGILSILAKGLRTGASFL